ncbi:hypothetical protein FRC09_011503 [Ceratobasidium sp. 395]|nr:hypothetical protein FRC09_011503 [Ceratobasidium sp. 395]
MCALALLCPSVVEISGGPYYEAWVEPPLASLLLQGLARTALDLERLRLLALSQKQIPYIKSSLFSNLATFRSLRVLHCSTAMIDSPVVLLLGTLPELESLKISAPAVDEFDAERDNGDPEDDLSLDDLVLPPESFHKLRYLNVRFLPCTVVSQLWSSAPLVGQLISVQVCFHPDDATPSDSTVINNAICDICRGSPNTIELCLSGYDVRFVDISPTAIACLQQLSSLRRLQLIHVHFPESFGDISLLISAVPSVEYLEIDRVDATFNDLVLIAQRLPKLRFLVANVILTGWPHNLEEYTIAPASGTLHLGSEFLFSNQTEEFDLDEDESMEDYIDLMAQHLHLIWPNGIVCEQEDTYRTQENSDFEHFNLLRSKLKVLNAPGFKPPTRKLYESAWLYQEEF